MFFKLHCAATAVCLQLDFRLQRRCYSLRYYISSERQHCFEGIFFEQELRMPTVYEIRTLFNITVPDFARKELLSADAAVLAERLPSASGFA